MSPKLLLSALLCVGVVAIAALVAGREGSSAGSWVLLLLPLACVAAHCLPMLFGSKHSCHSDAGERATEKDGGSAGSK